MYTMGQATGSRIRRKRREGKRNMRTYRFDSDAGEMRIFLDNGYWTLSVDGRRVGAYTAAEAAADDVEAHNTGYLPWDELDDAESPDTLEDWDVGEGP